MLHPVTGELVGTYKASRGILDRDRSSVVPEAMEAALPQRREQGKPTGARSPVVTPAGVGNSEGPRSATPSETAGHELSGGVKERQQLEAPLSGASEGPWAAQNAKRDAGLFLRVVLYALLSQDASLSAKAYATAIGRNVTERNEKSLLVLLSALTYFVGKVHFLRDDPLDDPDYLPYASLLASHFMTAASQCLPGPSAPGDDVRMANANRLAADVGPASMALVEALGMVGSPAIESVA